MNGSNGCDFGVSDTVRHGGTQAAPAAMEGRYCALLCAVAPRAPGRSMLARLDLHDPLPTPRAYH